MRVVWDILPISKSRPVQKRTHPLIFWKKAHVFLYQKCKGNVRVTVFERREGIDAIRVHQNRISYTRFNRYLIMVQEPTLHFESSRSLSLIGDATIKSLHQLLLLQLAACNLYACRSQ